MKELLRRPHLAGIGKGAEVPHQFCPVGRQGMEEVLKFFLDLRYASLHSGLSSFCPYSYAITGEHMQIDESVTSRVGAYGIEPPRFCIFCLPRRLSCFPEETDGPDRASPHLQEHV